jgi:hypothetical protein
VIDELMISLGIDASKAKSGMSEVTNSIQGGIGKITGMLGGLSAAFTGVFAVGSAFSEYLSQADALSKFAASIDSNIEDVHAWSEAVARSGGSAEAFQGTVKGLTTQLSKMATLGKSKAGNVLAAVGIDPGEIGRQRDAFDVLLEISDKMQEMSAAEATGFGQSLGLDAGTITLLREGRDGVSDLVRHQKELGVYDKETAKAAEEFNDALDDMKQAFTVLVATIGSSVLPGLKTLMEYVSKFVSYLRKHQTAVKAFFVMIGTLITAYLIPTFVAFGRALMTNPITWIILALVALALVIEDLIVWLEGGESALADFWTELFGSPEEAKQLFEDIKKAVTDFVDESIPKLQEFAEDVKAFIKDIRDLFNELTNSTPWQIFVHNVLQARRDQQDAMESMAEDAKRLVSGESTPDLFGGGGGGFEVDPIGDAIRNAIQEAQEAASSLWENFTGALSEVWDNVVGALQEGWSSFLEFGSDILNDIAKFAEDTFESIRKFFEDAMKECETAADHFSSAASSAIAALNGVISSLADNIRTNMIGAIEEASARWQAFQAEVSAGNAIIAASAGDYGGGGNYSNSSNTTWNVTMNGVENGQQAASDFRHGVGNRFSGAQSNAGVW